MATDMRSIFYQLEYLGLSDVILPFILVFVITWAILKKMSMFQDRKIGIIIALCLALAVVIPHATGRYPAGADVVEILNTALPQIGGVLIAIVMLMIMLGVWEVEASWDQYVGGIVILLSVAAVAYIFGRAAGWFQYMPSWLYWLDNPANQALIVILLIGGLIISFITTDSDQDKNKAPGSVFLSEIGKLFTKKGGSGGAAK